MSHLPDIRKTARALIATAFDLLRRDHVIPAPVFHPYLKVGRDYYGPEIMELAQFALLAQKLEDAYPHRFAEPLKRHHAEFAQTYIFSLLEASIARCALSGDYTPDSAAVSESLDEMLAILDASHYEAVCCRLISHFTTEDGQPLEIGPITVVPEDERYRSLRQVLAKQIPGASAAFNREPALIHDPPHALLIAKVMTDEHDPFAATEEVSSLLERFLLHVRLLTAGTVQSCYEVRGTTTLVTRMAPSLTTFRKGFLDNPVRRTVRTTDFNPNAVTAIGKLIDDADVRPDGTLFTSLDVAIRNFHGSYRVRNPFEHVVDLATALEAALSSGESDNEGLTLRLRNRAAALLATDDDPAPSIFTDVKQLYSLRSKLVHGGQIKERDLRKVLQGISTVPGERPTTVFAASLGHALVS
jgi:Apea-like HEPN